ncbi:hypothetical protein B0H12DRAFT_1325220 [Mycena haematopus]|nr:hypothetical protein B0H12DRAFT_1325220 [Mycena haematopus]
MDEQEPLRHVEGLWFSNDTIVLRAGNSIFRVSKAMLAARSSVFETMFEFPPSTSHGDQMMEGSPVVTLHDSPVEVEAFLRAIFDSNYFMPPPSPVDGDAALGILRLSHKYAVDYLYARAISQLETIYNIDPTIYKTLTYKTQPHQKETLAFHLKALPILIEVDAVWLLPMAFYSIGTYKLSDLRSAGTPWDSLPSAIRETCLPLAGIQLRATITISRFLPDHDPEQCDGDECALTKLRLVGTIVTRKANLSQDPLARYSDKSWDLMLRGFCTTCVDHYKEEHATAFAEVWDGLPQNCGLENWDVLLQRRKEVMG